MRGSTPSVSVPIFIFFTARRDTHTHPFNGPLPGTTRVSRYQNGKTSLDFTGATDSEWQWHQLGRMQVYILLQTDNHASTPPLSFLQAVCPSCRPTNSVKALKARYTSTVGLYAKALVCNERIDIETAERIEGTGTLS